MKEIQLLLTTVLIMLFIKMLSRSLMIVDGRSIAFTVFSIVMLSISILLLIHTYVEIKRKNE